MHLRPLTLMALAALCVAGRLEAQTKPQDKMTTPHSFSRKVSRRLHAQYLLFLPKDYSGKAAKRWPLLLFLHGAGERGTDVWRANIHGPIKYAAEHPDFPFILVSPLCPEDQTWSNELLLPLLEQISNQYKVDARRVYLTGLSMGGYGTWTLAVAAPERFAAVAPICGGGDALPLLLAAKGFSSPAKKQALQSLSIWAFHGGKDTVVPLSESERMVKAAKDLGAQEVKLTVYPEATHNSWAETYNKPKLYEWFLQHVKP